MRTCKDSTLRVKVKYKIAISLSLGKTEREEQPHNIYISTKIKYNNW